DRAELADRLVGPGEVAGHDVGRPAELAQGVVQLLGGLLRLGPGPLVGFRTVIAGPEYADLLHGKTSLSRSRIAHRVARPTVLPSILYPRSSIFDPRSSAVKLRSRSSRRTNS